MHSGFYSRGVLSSSIRRPRREFGWPLPQNERPRRMPLVLALRARQEIAGDELDETARNIRALWPFVQRLREIVAGRMRAKRGAQPGSGDAVRVRP